MNFDWRLATPERLGNAGVYKMGLGVLIGLEDWRTDSFMCALHLNYLEKHFWKSKYSISFPRLRPFSGGLEPKVDMSDRELVQLICAYRIFDEEVELSSRFIACASGPSACPRRRGHPESPRDTPSGRSESVPRRSAHLLPSQLHSPILLGLPRHSRR